ncbi:MAG: hypothetical protein KBD94_04790 [Pyrinomonadaceae bacterium]|nr:hypothetical protein [Pyrinomonadaceae bacterium]
MKTKIFVLFVAILGLGLSVTAQSVVVKRKKVTYTRPKPITEFKKTFVIHYPKVKAGTRAASRKIEAALSYEKAFAIDLKEEINEMQWLEEADYKVVYNKNGLLCVELWIQGTAAYPDGSTKFVVVDSRSGNRVLPGEVFVYIDGLVDMAKKAQKKQIADAIKEIKANKDWEEPEPEHLFETADFTMDNLKGFSIDASGVTFHYDYGFPHVIQAMQPDGEFAFTWAQMKPYIRVNSVLGRLVR